MNSEKATLAPQSLILHAQKQLEIEMVVVDKRIGTVFELPTKHYSDAGIDLRAMCDEPVTIQPGDTHRFSSGIKIHIRNPNYFLAIYPRSGLGTKGIILSNSTGVIDSGYTGLIQLDLYNRSKEAITIKPGDRVAQGVLQKVTHPLFKVVDEFTDYSERGEDGFGSSGMR